MKNDFGLGNRKPQETKRHYYIEYEEDEVFAVVEETGERFILSDLGDYEAAHGEMELID